MMKVFICQTPFQLFYSNQIIDYYQGLKSGNGDLIIHSNLNLKKIQWPSNVEFKNSKPDNNVFGDYLVLRNIIKSLDTLVKEIESDIEFFIPHIGGLISNYIFFNKTFLKKSNVKINFFYEGILYLYDFNEKFQKHHFNRIITAPFLGFIYKFQKRILPYNSKKIHHIYTPLIDFTKGKSIKKIEVCFKKNKPYPIEKSHRFLILGGPVSFLNDYYHECIKDILKTDDSNLKIFYKGHSSFKSHHSNQDKVFHKIATEHNLDYVEMDLNMPVELMVSDIMPSRIYSYYSSALLNIRQMSQEEFEILCYFKGNEQLPKQLKNIFQYYNIRMIRLN